MLRLQDEINSKINSDWRLARNLWYRAIWIECAELLEHVGWKWWKAQVSDFDQIHLEIVDIWHFGLSDILVACPNHSQAVQQIVPVLAPLLSPGAVKSFDAQYFLCAVERFAGLTLSKRAFDVALFADLVNAAGLSFESLFQQYVGKNVLNRFRQDHGYKLGTYVKTWQGMEDNVWLSDIIVNLDSSLPEYANTLYLKLSEHYQQYALSTER